MREPPARARRSMTRLAARWPWSRTRSPARIRTRDGWSRTRSISGARNWRRRSARWRERRISARDMAAFGVTNQRETTIVWERATGKPVAPAIVWQCRRTAAYCAELAASADAAQHHGGDGPGHRRIFLRQQDSLDSRTHARRAETGARWRAAVRQRRYLADLESDAAARRM